MSQDPAGPTLGMLDWGIGGCSVLAALQAHGVGCRVLYASDSGAPPYGKLTSTALAVRVQQVAEEPVSYTHLTLPTICSV